MEGSGREQFCCTLLTFPGNTEKKTRTFHQFRQFPGPFQNLERSDYEIRE
jgi:hypothetical protein